MMVCMKMQLAHAWIGTWFCGLAGAVAPRLTVDRKQPYYERIFKTGLVCSKAYFNDGVTIFKGC